MLSQYLVHLFVIYSFYILNFYGVKSTSQPLNNEEDPLEYKLTKLLDIHVGKESNNLQSSFRDAVRSELQNALEGPRDYVRSSNPTRISDGNVQPLLEALKELQSEISLLKKNIPKGLSSSLSHVYDVQNFINKSPVGVNYDSQAYSSFPSANIHFTNFWKNSSSAPKNCKEILRQGYNVSGIYTIQPVKTEKPFMALCDMETRDGGWTHIQKRIDGSQDFFLNWREYKFGFGDLEREFWLGLENIHSLTGSETYELLVEIVDRDNHKAYAHYTSFGIGPESTGYPLKVLSGYTGDAGDSLKDHLGKKFSTKDFDQDESTDHCAEKFSGAWWYRSNPCTRSNLNGKYRNADLPKKYEYAGMHWDSFKAASYSHSKSRMLIRPSL